MVIVERERIEYRYTFRFRFRRTVRFGLMGLSDEERVNFVQPKKMRYKKMRKNRYKN